MEDLLDYLHSIHPLSVGLRWHLPTVVKNKVIAKKEFLLSAGEVCRNLYFIRRGLLRCYYLKEETEVSSWFMREGDTVVAVDSFYNQRVSQEYIHALEETEVFYISYYDLEAIYTQYPEFNYIGRLLTLKYLEFWVQQIYSIRMRSARDRYIYLVKEQPELLRRVPQKYIATYLDMLPETLTRMKEFL